MNPPLHHSDEPAQKTDDSLIAADARAFVAENAGAIESPQNSSSRVETGTNAIDNVRQIRATSKKPQPIALYVTTTVLLALGLILTIVLTNNHSKTAGTPSPSSGLLTVPTPDSADTNDLPNQAQKDIKACSNTVNAILGAC